MNKQMPKFFADSSKNDPAEILVDYFLSWTLRCAVEEVKDSNPTLQQYSKRILSTFMYGDPTKLDNKKVKSVETWKQSSAIDLWVEVRIEGDDQLHAIIFENKMYSSLHDNQLQRYKEVVEANYKNKPCPCQYVFLTVKSEISSYEQAECDKACFKAFKLDDIVNVVWNGKNPADQKLTGNDLFDEFWFRWWC